MDDSNASGAKRGSNGANRKTLLVSTSHPSAVATAAASGALTLICPQSGTLQSSTRIQSGDLQQSSKGQVGVSSISLFPHRSCETTSSSLAIAYGSSTNKNRVSEADDSYGMLFTIRWTTTAAPILHWKCRLPESTMSGGLLVSPVTSRHIVGGGSSGTLYVWDVLQGGNLVRTIPSAHYRAISCMQWSSVDTSVTTSPWNSTLCTGGADGMVHAFSHVDLVERPSASQQGSSTQPIRTWTKHHLAVTALVAMNGGRMASASDDGQIVIMELCSGATLATIQLPDAIRALTTDAQHGRSLFAGSVKGTLHVVNLDSYALHRTLQMGATIVHIPKHQHQKTLEDRVFGTNTESATTASDESISSYQAEFRGHDRAVTSLAVYDEDDENGDTTEFLVSGDELGVVRVWDSRRGCCVRVIQPWSQSAHADASSDGKAKTAAATAQMRPVTSILVLRDDYDQFNSSARGDAAVFGSADTRKKGLNSYSSMVSPLQKFSVAHNDRSSSALSVAVPFVEPRRDDASGFWDLSAGNAAFEKAICAQQKRARHSKPDQGSNAVGSTQRFQHESAKVRGLEKELAEARETISRWEVVNNKLMSKIQQETVHSKR